MYYDEDLFATLNGKILREIFVDDARNEMLFVVDDDEIYKMYHDQTCCEMVYIEDICGDIEDLLNTPILQAEVAASPKKEDLVHLLPYDYRKRDFYKALSSPPNEYYDPDAESQTWTFYKLATIKGSVTIRWYGSSNGYYSESVDFVRIVSEDRGD